MCIKALGAPGPVISGALSSTASGIAFSVQPGRHSDIVGVLERGVTVGDPNTGKLLLRWSSLDTPDSSPAGIRNASVPVTGIAVLHTGDKVFVAGTHIFCQVLRKPSQYLYCVLAGTSATAGPPGQLPAYLAIFYGSYQVWLSNKGFVIAGPVEPRSNAPTLFRAAFPS